MSKTVKIGNIYNYKMYNTVREKENLFTGKISKENDYFRKKIIDGKRNTLEEFNTYMKTNELVLPNE